MRLSFREFVLANPGKLFEADAPYDPMAALNAMRQGTGLGGTTGAAQTAQQLPPEVATLITSGFQSPSRTPVPPWIIAALGIKPNDERGLVAHDTMSSLQAYPFIADRSQGRNQGGYVFNQRYPATTFFSNFGAALAKKWAEDNPQQQTQQTPPPKTTGLGTGSKPAQWGAKPGTFGNRKV